MMSTQHNVYGSDITLNEDGSSKINHVSGAKITTSKDGDMVVEQDVIKSLGIKHLPDVKSYSLTTENGVTTHRVEFHGENSYFVLSYDEDGKPHEMAGHNITHTITKNGEILVGKPAN